MLFKDRRHAGRLLAQKLGDYRDRDDVLILALPRGGVPVAPVVNRDKRLVGIVALGNFAVEKSEIKPAAKALSGISKPS